MGGRERRNAWERRNACLERGKDTVPCHIFIFFIFLYCFVYSSIRHSSTQGTRTRVVCCNAVLRTQHNSYFFLSLIDNKYNMGQTYENVWGLHIKSKENINTNEGAIVNEPTPLPTHPDRHH